MIITNMLLAAIFIILFCLWMTVSNIKIEVQVGMKKNTQVSDVIREADENERWG